MKKIFISLIIVALFIISCGDSNSSNTVSKNKTSVEQSAGFRIAVVNADSLLEKYDYYKDIKNVLDSKRQQMVNKIQDRRDALQRELDDYQRNANSLTADQRAIAEQRLMRKNQEFQKEAQDLERAVVENESQETEKLQSKIREFMNKFAKENGYQFIISSGQGSNLLYSDETFNVTDEVLNALNAQYDLDSSSGSN